MTQIETPHRGQPDATGRSEHAGEDAYDVAVIQDRWLGVWDELAPFRSGRPDDARPRKYVLDMFPYPSGDLHMGHAEAYALGDVVARYWVQRGFNVMHPIGWDSFGLPAENAAIKRGADPRQWTYENISQQLASMRRYACSFDWDRILHTSDPEYYRWNQWLFNRFHERGLAYRKPSQVNWCPTDQTVLANEQVVDGLCERCDTPVTKKKLTQWYFRITSYADRLLDDMAQLEGGWPDRVLTMQRNWIGRSTGADVVFAIEDAEGRVERSVTVYTTRPDTLFGATFFVVAADSDLAAELVSSLDGEGADDVRSAFGAYLDQVRRTSEIDRLATDRPKTGVFLGRYAVNPVNGERIPIYAADYVLADYGHGAIMAVPAHDQRDLDFATAFDLPVRTVVDVRGPDGRVAARPGGRPIRRRPGDGVLVNSGPLDGLAKDAAIARIIEILAEKGLGAAATNYRLRDWLISRQRYWGTPIPIVHCRGLRRGSRAGLPTAGRAAAGRRPGPAAEGHLASGWGRGLGQRRLPASAAVAARRDTDTMDTFVDSSWYFLRFCLPEPGRRAVRRRGGQGVAARRPVRRRRHPRDPAPAVRAVLHQGAARPGHGRLSPSRSPGC